jgi:hypothetical protein
MEDDDKGGYEFVNAPGLIRAKVEGFVWWGRIWGWPG